MQVVIQVVNNKKVMAKTPREANLYGNWCVRKGLRQAWTDQKRDFWRRSISNFFAPKSSLDFGDLLFQVSALFFD